MAEINSDEKVVVAKSSINIANIILAVGGVDRGTGTVEIYGALPDSERRATERVLFGVTCGI